ncbi:isochorismatase family protein [Corynebacterium uberis]|uniref:isochorismatase family protein n=1 Tax=Corynebacterium TaxID=1716 RepID=UPI001D0AFE75|nr:isochorismatase family protein [Corynebacterium uberis]MCZ9309406.1 isochorismatase family protein [Corynebacterium sp. c6VSa_13]UDL72956.1 isochorismatase family protein [Corynebacterium uberis]UDL76167.1 isochorismatase family protein [Corynebacterium uberis]UDL78379.1 isochorismatase family protein [Corynebacterium uberis]UDL80662.1 isochorismatase family protein [Corynebacterium uberis]
MPIPHIESYRIPSDLPTPVVDWTLQPQRAALLVHDMQNYFIDAFDPDADPIRTVIANIQQLIALFDAAGAPVFYSVQPPAQDPLRRGLLTEVWGQGMSTKQQAAVIEALHPQPHHHVVTKWRYSAFQRTDLRETLAHARRDQLVITGVYGHMGCQVSAADAFMNDIEAFLITDAIADFSAREHAGAINWVGTRAGVAMTTAAAVASLEAQQ